MHPLVHCWMVKMMVCLGPGVLVNGVDAEDGLYNGFCRMDCVWRAVKNLLTRRRVGLAEGSVTECLCKLILFCQMLEFWWNQIGTISWYLWALITGVFIAVWRFALAGGENNYNNMAWNIGNHIWTNKGNLLCFTKLWQSQWREGQWGVSMILKTCWFQLVVRAGHAWGKGINSRSRGNYTHSVWIVDAPGQSKTENGWPSWFNFGTNKNSGLGRRGRWMQFYHAKHPGNTFPEYRQHRTEQCRNSRNQMNLPTCLRNSLLVILVVICYRHNLQKLRGKKARCTRQSSGWRYKNQLMNVALSQKFWNMCRILSLTPWWVSSMIWWGLARYQLIGEKHHSKCCQKPYVLRFLQNTARLQPYDCFTNFLPTWSWDGWKLNLKPTSQKNNMVFGVAGVWKSIWWLHAWSWTNFPMQTCRFGLSAWTCRRLSTEYIGQHCGSLFQKKAFQNTWFGWSKIYIETNRGKLLAAMVAAGLLPYTVEYDKDVF